MKRISVIYHFNILALNHRQRVLFIICVPQSAFLRAISGNRSMKYGSLILSVYYSINESQYQYRISISKPTSRPKELNPPLVAY